MAYTMLKNKVVLRNYSKNTLEEAALTFIRERCEGLRFDTGKVTNIKAADFNSDSLDSDGTSIEVNQIPYNMEKDIDRLCLENAIDRFLNSGRKEDAFDVYFCYLEMFVGDYKKTRRMIELLSEYEANGSGLLMKHRDHYSHSVYVFILGLAIYETNETFRNVYKEYYKQNFINENKEKVTCNFDNENEAAGHYLQYWGLSSLFHDIGYPFELPFEQVSSYFEVNEEDRTKRPFIAYHSLQSFTKLHKATQRKLGQLYGLGTEKILGSTDELFAYALHEKLGKEYYFSENEMYQYLTKKPTEPDKFNHFMDHAYFSATVLFKKLFEEVKLEISKEYIDALTAIILHNSLYKFSVAFYDNPDANIRLKPEWHPLAYMLMLCDELQSWDRTAYGRNSKLELHPMDCRFSFSHDVISATYIFDEKQIVKIEKYKKDKAKDKKAKLKAYSSYVETEEIERSDKSKDKVTKFQADIERIVDLSQIRLTVESSVEERPDSKKKGYLSDSNYINLYTFATVLNGMWANKDEWKTAKNNKDNIEKFLSDEKRLESLAESFGNLSLEYKLSNINQAKAFAKYMNEIGCFYTDKAVDFEQVEEFDFGELETIGELEHWRWLQEHYNMGWVYGEPKKEEREKLRQHKDMIPDFAEGQFEVPFEAAKANYKNLHKTEKEKDKDPMECMLAMLKMFDGIRIYRLK